MTGHNEGEGPGRGYEAGRGVLPLKPGDPLPEDAIRG